MTPKQAGVKIYWAYRSYIMSPMSRSENMRRIRSHDTEPELAVRRLLHEMGFRFRLHRSDLPGRPDVTMPRYKTVIFVHGCFWHGHGCRRGRLPKSNLGYWEPKIRGNRVRDAQNCESLVKRGWRPMIVWECEVQHREELKIRLESIKQGKHSEPYAP